MKTRYIKRVRSKNRKSRRIHKRNTRRLQKGG